MTLKLTPDTVAVLVLVGVRVQGKFCITGTPHRALEPLTVAAVIDAEEPSTAVLPVNVMLQVTGRLNDAGDFTVMVPGALKVVFTGVMVAALTMDAAPKQTAMAVNDTRVLMPFIVVIPHMLWRFISPGIMAFNGQHGVPRQQQRPSFLFQPNF